MKPQVILLVSSLLFVSLLGCGNLGRRNNAASEADAAAEKERKAKIEKCSQEKQSLAQLDADVDNLARLPAKTQLASAPYLKGKLFIVETRDKRNYVNDTSGPGCRMSKDCSRDAGCSPTSYDKFTDVRARSVAEVGSVALIECRKIKHGEFVKTGSSSGEKIPGYDLSCNMTLVDRTIPAVIYKKTFDSKLLMVEDQTSVALTGAKELVARTPTSEMDEFLLNLPRR
jgi:hypothetical protein